MRMYTYRRVYGGGIDTCEERGSSENFTVHRPIRRLQIFHDCSKSLHLLFHPRRLSGASGLLIIFAIYHLDPSLVVEIRNKLGSSKLSYRVYLRHFMGIPPVPPEPVRDCVSITDARTRTLPAFASPDRMSPNTSTLHVSLILDLAEKPKMPVCR